LLCARAVVAIGREQPLGDDRGGGEQHLGAAIAEDLSARAPAARTEVAALKLALEPLAHARDA
jgi:hypothetical protein